MCASILCTVYKAKRKIMSVAILPGSRAWLMLLLCRSKHVNHESSSKMKFPIVMSGTCQIRLRHLSDTCQIFVGYVSDTCMICVRYVYDTCQERAWYVQYTCHIRVRNVLSTCMTHVRYVSDTWLIESYWSISQTGRIAPPASPACDYCGSGPQADHGQVRPLVKKHDNALIVKSTLVDSSYTTFQLRFYYPCGANRLSQAFSFAVKGI
jgi:hypothetical protein